MQLQIASLQQQVAELQMLATVADKSPDGVFILGPDHVIDHDLDWEVREHLIDGRKILDVEQELDVPAQWRHTVGQALRRRCRVTP